MDFTHGREYTAYLSEYSSKPVPMHTQDATIDVSVVIVNYNVREFLVQALRSLQHAMRGVEAEVWVVDNNSIDDSVAAVRETFPDVHVIANRENAGFGRANNQAIRQARGEFIFILNPDTIVQEDTLTHFLAFMRAHPDCGAAGCRILNPDGSFAPESRRSFPTPSTAFYRMTGLARVFPKSRTFGRYNMTFIPETEACEVDALSGSCMMVRRRALDTAGLFDEEFFMYGEDLDLCFRIQEAGWTIRYTPGTQIIHYKGESTKKGEVRYVKLFYGAMLLFIEKHLEAGGRQRRMRILTLFLRIGIVLRAALTLCGNVTRRVRRPLVDALVVAATTGVLGGIRFLAPDVSFAPRFYATIVPVTALASVVGMALAGAYRRSAQRTVRATVLGTTSGFLLIGTLSFFVQNIAYSRWVIGLGLPLSVIALLAVHAWLSARRRGSRRALVVGGWGEATRLAGLLKRHPSPPFHVEGYVRATEPRRGEGAGSAGRGGAGADPTAASSGAVSDPTAASGGAGAAGGGGDDRGSGPQTMGTGPGGAVDAGRAVEGGAGPPLLGSPSQLRDLVRLRGFSDIVFAAQDVPNQVIFTLMRELNDLGVQFRMFSEGQEHVVGKSTIAHVSVASLLSQLKAVEEPRSPAMRRATHRLLALTVLATAPAMWPLSRLLRRKSVVRALMDRLPELTAVARGRLALVGSAPEHAQLLPASWAIRPGMFPVMNPGTNTMDAEELTPDEIRNAYWFYAMHQSLATDLDIVAVSLR